MRSIAAGQAVIADQTAGSQEQSSTDLAVRRVASLDELCVGAIVDLKLPLS